MVKANQTARRTLHAAQKENLTMKQAASLSLPTLALALTLFGPMGQALAAGEQAAVDAQYEKDRQACVAKQGSVESREACLREAGAVRQAALRGTLSGDASAAELRRNALSRCEVHQDAVDRAACQRMVEGEGASQGSVESGGIVRETITIMQPASAVDPGAMPPAK
ncbi:hypothetical protein LPB72_03455 [Hydrogenophaga crassostreae]|uniref:Lysozyme inhibitor LprI N-terminal domain-containing protein n=3 Tax=Hydrogenophaga crassostreae TaxID=1763535 RepID=A0ABX2UAG4_9BURK|nr:hypothetical protein LPB72_03455 [Hydrogenophaga crassostreae]